MRLKFVPKIDPYQFTRNNLKVLKLKGSQSGQATFLIEKSSHLAAASQGDLSVNDFSLTTAPVIAKKLNII